MEALTAEWTLAVMPELMLVPLTPASIAADTASSTEARTAPENLPAVGLPATSAILMRVPRPGHSWHQVTPAKFLLIGDLRGEVCVFYREGPAH